MADWGIKVSEPGYDVKTAADKNLSLKSDLTLLKVYSSGTATMTGNQTVAHNLGYVPQFLVFVKDSVPKSTLATGHVGYAVAYADTTNLYIIDIGTAATAKYYIFYEQA